MLLKRRIGCLFVALLLSTSLALAQSDANDNGGGSNGTIPGDTVPVTDAESARAYYDAEISARALETINEVSNRRRLTSFFENAQSPKYGVQLNYVNVGRGNLTFTNRDLVAADRIPIVMGRVYDSAGSSERDFGPGWKLSVVEILERSGPNELIYRDSNNAEYVFTVSRGNVIPANPHFHGIRSGTIDGGQITLHDDDFKRSFRKIGNKYLLVKVSDRWGNFVKFDYQGQLLSAARSSGGREVMVERNERGLVSSIRDDVGRVVRYTYTNDGQLASVVGLGGGEWAYDYDSSARLVAVTDPRGVQVAEASFGPSGKTTAVRVLNSGINLRYEKGKTLVSNALGEQSLYRQHRSGLTEHVLDYSGAKTSVAFDSRLLPSSFFLNGQVLAEYSHSVDGLPTAVKEYLGDNPTEYSVTYAKNGYVAAVMSGDESVALYEYGDNNELLYAQTLAAQREYSWTDDGRLASITVNETVLNLESDSRGQLTNAQFENGEYIHLEYDNYDRVQTIDFGNGDTAQYLYEEGAFRSGAQYSAGNAVAMSYDAVGNLIEFRHDESGGQSYTDAYQIGEDNQLDAIVSDVSPTFLFEYDAAGRVENVSADSRRLHVEYDKLSRVARAEVDDEEVYSSAYGPMDADSASSSDQLTFFTYVLPRASLGIFGSLDEINYSRLRVSEYGLVRFDAEMGRFVLAGAQVLAPDLINLASLSRRQIPVDGSDQFARASSIDKPSNVLFIPPELVSVNCFFCTAVILNHELEINGSTNPSPIAVGEAANFSSDATVIGCFLKYSSFDINIHSISYMDGSGDNGQTSGWVGHFGTTHAYSTTGTYNVGANMECLCSPFAISHVNTSLNVVNAPQNVTVKLTMFIPLNHVRAPGSEWGPPPVNGYNFGADNVVTWDPNDTFRVQQGALISTSGLVSESKSPGLATQWSYPEQFSTVASCLNKNCAACNTYPGGQEIVFQGHCIDPGATPVNTEFADGMGSVFAEVVGGGTPATIYLRGSPFNPIPTLGPNIDWNIGLQIHYDSATGIQSYTLAGTHDGFPSYQLRLNDVIIWSYDPLVAGKTPLALFGSGDQVIASVTALVP